MQREIFFACLPFLMGIILSVFALRVLIAFSGARLKLAHLRNLHRDEMGGVQSLSFVLTLPVFIMILMFIVQLSQLTIAKAVVEYSAFSAARSAIVWIGANDLSGEHANQIAGYRVLDGSNGDATIYKVTDEPFMFGSTASAKCDKICFAAAVALMPICPSRDLHLDFDHPSVGAMQRAYVDVAPTSVNNARVFARLRNKIGYALANTRVTIRMLHPNSEPELRTYDEIPPEPDSPFSREFAMNEYGWQDQISVTVEHQFALLPGPGRLLAARAPDPRDPLQRDEVADKVDHNGNTYVYPLTGTVRLKNEGQKSRVPFFQNMYGQMGT